MNGKIFKKSLIDTLPVLVGYIVLGIGFGVLVVSSGYNFYIAPLMSVFIYAGSMQYVLVDLLNGGVSVITLIITTVSVNFRHIFYGISMLDKYKETGLIKPYLIHSLTDETFSLVCKEYDTFTVKERKSYYTTVSVLDQIYWVVGGIIGALIGNINPLIFVGIDFSLTALFVTVYTDQVFSKVKERKIPTASIVGIVSSAICLIIFGKQNFLIPSMVVITAVLLIFYFIDKQKKAVKENE